MALYFLDKDFVEIDNSPIRTSHDGYIGQADQVLFFIRNRNPSVYYRNISLTPKFRETYTSSENFDSSSWSVKLYYGTIQPSEDEWDKVFSGETLNIPDIGSIEAPDTFTNHPIWVRVYCPGNTEAQIKENIFLELLYNEEKVRTE